jgi:ABC-2 type transport system permease protein
MAAKQGLAAHFVRTLAFVRKELWSIIRQPRLIMTLVIGPFLILLIFGLGYTETSDPFRTLLVVQSEEARIAADLDDLSEAFGSSIDLVGTTTDADEGRARLQRNEADLLIIAPTEALESIQAGEKADFTVVHSQVDPIIRRSIELLARLSVDEINRQVLAAFVAEAQETSSDAEAPVTGLTASADALVAALEAGDDAAADQQRQTLEDGIEAALAEDQAGALYQGVGEALGITAGSVLAEIMGDLEGTSSGDPAAVENARAARDALAEFEAQLDQAQDLEPELLVSPFGSQVETLRELPAEPAVFYAPGVLMLLVQHLAVTFAALSLVRERELGVTEIFRVSPLSVTEAIVGKYLAFVLIVGAVAAALSGTMLLFGVPLASAGWMYVVTVVLVILASLGLGFWISGISQTDSQAIQYAMIVLLVSIFFTGFIIPLDRLLEPVQALSFLLPATFGIAALHDLVFRGAPAETAILAGLALYTVLAAVLAWFAARRDVSPSAAKA